MLFLMLFFKVPQSYKIIIAHAEIHGKDVQENKKNAYNRIMLNKTDQIGKLCHQFQRA